MTDNETPTPDKPPTNRPIEHLVPSILGNEPQDESLYPESWGYHRTPRR